MKVALPANPAVEAEVDLRTTDRAYFLQTRLNVRLPGVELSHATGSIGPMSSAVVHDRRY
jgi:hypothetical protein